MNTPNAKWWHSSWSWWNLGMSRGNQNLLARPYCPCIFVRGQETWSLSPHLLPVACIPETKSWWLGMWGTRNQPKDLEVCGKWSNPLVSSKQIRRRLHFKNRIYLLVWVGDETYQAPAYRCRIEMQHTSALVDICSSNIQHEQKGTMEVQQLAEEKKIWRHTSMVINTFWREHIDTTPNGILKSYWSQWFNLKQIHAIQ